MADESLKYVSRTSSSRSKDKDKPRKESKSRRKSRRESRRTSSGRRSSKTTTISALSYSSDSDLMGGSDSNHHDEPMVDNSTPEHFMTPKTRAGVSPSFYDASNEDHFDGHTSNVFEYGSKYVRPPTAEPEQDSLLQSSKDADPDDPLAGFENFQDEFEDEMDEIEMHAMSGRGGTERKSFINLADMEAKNKRRRRLRKCCLLASLFLLVGAVAGVVVWQLASKDKPTPIVIQAVPEANKLLKLWCAEELDLGPTQSLTYPLEVPEDCKVACNKAECCWNPKSNYECSQETEKFCDAYKAPCEIMVHHIISDAEGTLSPTAEEESGTATAPQVEVPTAPATLKTTCVPIGPDFVASNNCYNICSKGDCCWNTRSKVHCTADSKSANCGPYEEFCSFFNEHPPQNIDGSEPVKEESGSSGVIDPYHDPFPEAPTGLSVYCDPSEMEELSLHVCQDKCEPGACCWNTHVENCDSHVRPELCEPYFEACSILNDLVSYPDSNGANTNTKPSYTPGPAPADTDTAETYTNGAEVPAPADNADTNNVPEAPSDFDTRCAKENILGSSNGGDILIACEKDCLAASCCWKPGDDACPENSRCTPYKDHCAIFAGLFGGDTSGSSSSGNSGSSNSGSSGANSVGGTSSSASNMPPAPSDINSVCAPEKLKTSFNQGQSIVECEKKCLPASCCWKSSSSMSCEGFSGCDAYMEPCATNLISALTALEQGSSIAEATGTQDSEAAQQVSRACDNQQAIFIKTNCQDACRPGNCCFDDAMACSTSVDCSIYEPCGVLFRRNLRH